MLIIQGVLGESPLLNRYPDADQDSHHWDAFRCPFGAFRVALPHWSFVARSLPEGYVLITEKHQESNHRLAPRDRRGAWIELRWSTDSFEIITDRTGTIPVYWTREGQHLWFASRITDLGTALSSSPEPDVTGVLQTILLDHPIGDRTALKGIQLLPPASYCRFHADNELSTETYWSPPPVNPEAVGNIQSWRDEAIDRLRLVHARHLPDCRHDQIALPVTGGLDSRCNLALHPELARHARLFHCHDLGTVEWPYAKSIGRCLGQEVEVLDSTESMRHPEKFDIRLGPGDFNIGHWRLVETARYLAHSGARATVDGFLQDFLFKGSFLRDEDRDAQVEKTVAGARYRARRVGIAPIPETFEALDNAIRTAYPTASTGIAASQAYYLQNRSRRLIYSIVRTNQNFLDVRTPALDPELMEFALAMPWKLRENALLYRHIIHALDPSLAAVPYDRTGLPLLDPRPRSRRKAFTRRVRPYLDRLWPGRPFLQPAEDNFTRLARRDKEFRQAAGSLLGNSRWLRECLHSRHPQELLSSSTRMGTTASNCLGGMLTIAMLERTLTSP